MALYETITATLITFIQGNLDTKEILACMYSITFIIISFYVQLQVIIKENNTISKDITDYVTLLSANVICTIPCVLVIKLVSMQYSNQSVLAISIIIIFNILFIIASFIGVLYAYREKLKERIIVND